MNNGGYDDGYRACSCFWGENPGSLLIKLDEYVRDYTELKALDLGCGEGKNSLFLANKGAYVDAFDISPWALKNARLLCSGIANVTFNQADAMDVKLKRNQYDIIVCYGLLHCLQRPEQIHLLVEKCLNSLKKGGFFLICAFNSREQDLSAHKDFNPLLLAHDQYIKLLDDTEILHCTDEDLHEVHPHNNIPHKHSMTRLIVRK